MRNLLTDEQAQFADAVDRFVAREYATGPAAPRHAFDRARHVRLAGLGCLSLSVPAELGGIGGGVEIMLASERLAPALIHEPFLPVLHATALLSGAGLPVEVQPHLESIMAGELVAVVAAGTVLPLATRSPSGWRIFGRVSMVPSAADANLFIIAARTDAGQTALALVERAAAGISLTPAPRLDGQPAAHLDLTSVEISDHLLLSGGNIGALLDSALNMLEMAEAAAMVGLMTAAIRTTADYLRTRTQFGVPLSSFQVLQHRLADMWMACEEARSLAYAAAVSIDAGSDQAAQAVSFAKVRACDAAQLVAAESVQMHGAVGMTDDLIVSHWFRRLAALRSEHGGRRRHLARIAA